MAEDRRRTRKIVTPPPRPDGQGTEVIDGTPNGDPRRIANLSALLQANLYCTNCAPCSMWEFSAGTGGHSVAKSVPLPDAARGCLGTRPRRHCRPPQPLASSGGSSAKSENAPARASCPLQRHGRGKVEIDPLPSPAISPSCRSPPLLFNCLSTGKTTEMTRARRQT